MTRREAAQLVRVLALGNFKDRHQANFEIERKAPIVNVPEVQGESLFDIRDSAHASTEAIDLGPSGNARFDVVTISVVGDQPTEFGVMR